MICSIRRAIQIERTSLLLVERQAALDVVVIVGGSAAFGHGVVLWVVNVLYLASKEEKGPQRWKSCL